MSLPDPTDGGAGAGAGAGLGTANGAAASVGAAPHDPTVEGNGREELSAIVFVALAGDSAAERKPIASTKTIAAARTRARLVGACQR